MKHLSGKTAIAVLLIGLCLVAACIPKKASQTVQPFSTDSSPLLLSQWGVVQRHANKLRLGEAVLPFDLNTPLFTDYAHKLRTVWMPEGRSAQYSPGETFEFPRGTILSKTFYYPRMAPGAQNSETPSPSTPLLLATDNYANDFSGHELNLAQVYLVETRLLVLQKDGWQALAYIWNESQSDANLEIAGDIKTLELQFADGKVSNFHYVIPTRNECASCHASDHTSGELLPIGPKTRHLDKKYAHYKAGAADQLSSWQSMSYLKGAPTQITTRANALWNASSRDNLAHRARSYLDINCAHCHNPQGSADTSGLFLHMAESTPRRLGTCKPPVAAGRGSGNHEFAIVPGKAKESILTFRMQTVDPGEMMPELGRSTYHSEGLELISDWINTLEGDCV